MVKPSKKRRYQVVVYNSDEMSFNYVIDTFQTILGYELVQATSCANLIDQLGKYVVKSFAEKDHATATADLLLESGFEVEIIDIFA